MPRYVVERTFPNGLTVPSGAEGAQACLAVLERNADESVTWLHSYVSEDRQKNTDYRTAGCEVPDDVAV